MAAPKRILSIDIGGTGLKAAVVDANGKLLTERVRVATPHPCPPALLITTLSKLVEPLKPFDCASVGFPGVVRGSKVITAPHLGTEDYEGVDLGSRLSQALGKPVRIVNDADMQGLAVARGKGIEVVITLGTGFGSALFRDGELMPHLEIAHMPGHGKKTFEEYIGEKQRKKIGNRHWNERVARLLPYLKTLINYDKLYIGGGNAKHVAFKLPRDVHIVSNIAGIKGGAALWRQKNWK